MHCGILLSFISVFIQNICLRSLQKKLCWQVFNSPYPSGIWSPIHSWFRTRHQYFTHAIWTKSIAYPTDKFFSIQILKINLFLLGDTLNLFYHFQQYTITWLNKNMVVFGWVGVTHRSRFIIVSIKSHRTITMIIFLSNNFFGFEHFQQNFFIRPYMSASSPGKTFSAVIMRWDQTWIH